MIVKVVVKLTDVNVNKRKSYVTHVVIIQEHVMINNVGEAGTGFE